ncbi:hypothetical protein MCUN1_000174 [Malassezia cuniculi]|uniref:Uncharacterized protein n=1 Tax=Malassezia cuniculi TaxID=948313 RepID=A0AAF0J9J1_9BASI|nr:hypothetical protein MCUN1_000174 [Malassezia cuniculi]
MSYSKYTSITAQVTRQALKESERAIAERRATQVLRYQKWDKGTPSENIDLSKEQH